MHCTLRAAACARMPLGLLLTVWATAVVDAADPKPPLAPQKPFSTRIHGDVLHDPFFWLREKGKPEVTAYLEAENAYTAAMTERLEPFRKTLYQEALARIQQTDSTLPTPEGEYLYYSRTEEGKQYPLRCRRRRVPGAPEEVLLDANELAKGHKFFSLGSTQVSPDGQLLAYATDITGFREYFLSVKDLHTGKLLEERRVKTNDFVWAADNQTLFYVTENAAKRPYRLYRHVVCSKDDTLLLEEKDELFELNVSRSRDWNYLLLSSDSSESSEVRYVPAWKPASDWRLILPREEKHLYSVDHHNGQWWIRTNKGAKEFRVVTAPLTNPTQWTEVVPARPGVTVEGITLLRDWVVISERDNGLQQLTVRNLKTGESHRIDWPEQVYSVSATPTSDWDATTLRFRYTSPVTPSATYEYDLARRTRKLLRQDRVLGKFDSADYQCERIFATAEDGTRIPISLVYRKGTARDGKAPMWLQGYGSYGASVPLVFSSNNLLLLDRGVIVAWAHIRGGGDMGKSWHDTGKMLNKKNTFTDFIACADHLVNNKYTSRNRLAIQGGSAGGLLIGAVLNNRPDLCKVAVLDVPFVDVINTMLDPSLPLTVPEYLEWGNPNKKDEYHYMRSYCPYTNLQAMDYPAMLVTTSLNDSQVMYWEPAKYVAKLRRLKTNATPLLFKCNMAGGHSGASGRYDALAERVFTMAFVLDQLGIQK